MNKIAKEFEQISIRGRVAFSINCLENAINFYRLGELNWDFLLNILWSYTEKDIGVWHLTMSECTPFSVIGQTNYVEDLEYITVQELKDLEVLYQKSNNVLIDIIDLIFNIGTRDLYSNITNNSSDTLQYLSNIINLLVINNIPLPNIEVFKQFSINENEGWGNEFNRDKIG